MNVKMLNSLQKELRDKTGAEVHFDEIHKRIYSVDASIFEIEPLGVCIPKNKDDLIKILQIAKKHQVAVIARGAATGITGGCLGKALIIDLSKYFTKILEINIEKEYVRVEPGVVQDQLNEALSPFGYRLGPDTSTGNRATIGGMMANNSAGARSLHYGKMVDHVKQLEMVLATGELLTFQQLSEKEIQEKLTLNTIEGTIYRELLRILTDYKEEIENHFPKIPRRVSGYNLDLLNKNSIDLCKLITGSEGTLGIATEITLNISKKPKSVGLCVISFHEIIEGMKVIPFLLSFQPIALEMIDDIILKNSKQFSLTEIPKMIFIAEFAADTKDEVEEKLEFFKKSLEKENIGYKRECMTDEKEMSAIWNIRKAGLGILLSKKSYSRAIAFIEDLSIPPEKLYAFMSKFQAYLEKIGKTAGIYGHVGSGCMHIRPYIDLRRQEEIETLNQIMLDVAELVLEQGGALSGEHGDGLIRSWLTQKMFGKRLTEAFIAIKHAFDPENLMNPGKIVPSPLPLNHLRINPETVFPKIETFLSFETEGGFNLAVDLCNGNGLCRKKEGIMCPSFQASSDEYDTTRARAQSLRAIVNGKTPKEALTGDEIYDVLDLCIECKGCKTECPSQVDMAKIKSELLFQRQEKLGYPLRNRLFAYISRINRFTAPFARLFNYLSDTFLIKQLLEMIGITKRRKLPKLATTRFSTWFKNYSQQSTDKKVVLFNDTYNEFNEPNIGISAVKVLNHFGFEVIIPPLKCCGRPMISKGVLKEAKKQAEAVFQQLLPYVEAGYPIIGLEPSCILTIKDDFKSLLGKKCDALVNSTTTFDEFMYKVIKERELEAKTPLTILVHGHCHQKSLVGMKPTLELLKRVKNVQVKEIDSGCCGMAGSFGYEKEHYDFSMKIGNLKLFPTIRQAENATVIIANGFSCRAQVLEGTGKLAKHLAEILYEFIHLTHCR